MPVAISIPSAPSAAAGQRRTHTRTHRAEKHEAGEGDDPEVHGIDHVTTVELEERWGLDTLAISDEEPTIRPSASQLFKRNIRLGTVHSILELDHEYPSGPGVTKPSIPGNSRLSMKETD